MHNLFQIHLSKQAKVRLVCSTAITVLSVLAGCSQNIATCSEESTTSVVKKIYQDSIDDMVAAASNSSELKSQIAAATSVALNTILTVSKDEKVGKVSCEAELSVKVPDLLANALEAPGNPLSMSAQKIGVQMKNGHMEKTVQYTAQITDDQKQVSVSTQGVVDMGQLIAAIAMVGVFKPSAPAAAPAATPAEISAKAVAEPTPEQIAADGGNTHADLDGPSFSCEGKLSKVESLICKTPSLWEADVQLAELYTAVMPKAPDLASFKEQQRAWRKTRDVCADVACVQAAYSSRIKELTR